MEIERVPSSGNKKAHLKTHLSPPHQKIPVNAFAQYSPLEPNQNQLNSAIMNMNRKSFEQDKPSLNKLICPVAKRVYPGQACFLANLNNPSNYPSPSIDYGVRKVPKFEQSSQKYFNFRDLENGKTKLSLHSPGTTNSLWSNYPVKSSRVEGFKIFSGKPSPNPFGFNEVYSRKKALDSRLISLKKNVDSNFPRLLSHNQNIRNTIWYNPQTNNNVNIYNLNHSGQNNLLKTRNYDEFQSNKVVWNSSKKTRKKKLYRHLEKKQYSEHQEDSLASPQCEEKDLQISLKIKTSCSEKSKHNQLKKEIFSFFNELEAKNPGCLELSFDNSSQSEINQSTSDTLEVPPVNKPAPPLVLSNNGDSFELIRNIVWNSFLRNNKQPGFQRQLESTMDKILNKLKNNNKLIYHKVNIFTLINLQIPLENEKFHALSSTVKLRVICMLFAKYVNRKPFVGLCSNFLTSIDLSESSAKKSIFPK